MTDREIIEKVLNRLLHLDIWLPLNYLLKILVRYARWIAYKEGYSKGLRKGIIDALVTVSDISLGDSR